MNKSARRRLFSVIIILLIVYIIYHLALSASSEVTLSDVETVTVSETDSFDGFIFKSEEVLYSPTDGIINYNFPDGESVRKETAVATVYTGTSNDETKKRLIEIDKEITVLENSDLGDSSGASDGNTVDNNIYDIINNIRRKQFTGNSEYSLRRKDDILTLLNRRSYLTDTTDYGARISELQAEKRTIMQSLGGNTVDVLCGDPGRFYSNLDGYEDIFSADKIDAMSYDEFNDIISREPDMESIQSDGKYGIGKVVTDYRWYTACTVSPEQLKYYSLGSTYMATFPYNGDSQIKMVLYRIISGGSAGSVLVFRSGINPEGFNFLRRQSVKIIRDSYTGYKVPVSSVHINDKGETGVYILKGNVVRFKKIKSLTESGGYFVVEEQDRINDPDYASKLGRSDLLIAEGTDLYDGKIIS